MWILLFLVCWAGRKGLQKGERERGDFYFDFSGNSRLKLANFWCLLWRWLLSFLGNDFFNPRSKKMDATIIAFGKLFFKLLRWKRRKQTNREKRLNFIKYNNSLPVAHLLKLDYKKIRRGAAIATNTHTRMCIHSQTNTLSLSALVVKLIGVFKQEGKSATRNDDLLLLFWNPRARKWNWIGDQKRARMYFLLLPQTKQNSRCRTNTLQQNEEKRAKRRLGGVYLCAQSRVDKLLIHVHKYIWDPLFFQPPRTLLLIYYNQMFERVFQYRFAILTGRGCVRVCACQRCAQEMRLYHIFL